jgi:asparagine synthase (glutamine-hydrolysing)
MCGIVGMFDRRGTERPSEAQLRQMLAMLRHRGPDEFGILLDREAGLGNARLSIIDLSSGSQPIANEDESYWIVFNGEIFNYIELRAELEAAGHRFRTSSDTEVILHLYEDLGPGCLAKLNGQFAIAIWNCRERKLFLARDRVGVRPVFYTETVQGTLLFASEIKAILSDPRVKAELDPAVIDQVFRFWSPLTPNTAFKHIHELPPGHYLVADRQQVEINEYWTNSFPATNGASVLTIEDTIAQFRDLLVDACRIRLRADVPVGAYLSGGIDSSSIAAIVRRHTGNRLVTFSIAFDDEKFDESTYQKQMAAHLGTDHHVVVATHREIATAFPEVVWHAEVPILRTAPAPMFLLSRLVRQHGFKVVLTGEGADEFLAGYDIFKEAKVRQFCARQPASKRRPLLFNRLYPDIGGFARTNPSFLSAFFQEGLKQVGSPWYSHEVRWRNGRRARRFLQNAPSGEDEALDLQRLAELLPDDFGSWHALSRAQFLEVATFLSPYLLSSQGDRMAMAHSVEGRFPFLDVRVMEFCNRVDPRLKLRGLCEKWLLKQVAEPWLPNTIRTRAKRPYRAPVYRSFFSKGGPEYVRELLQPEAIRDCGIFKPAPIGQLVRKIDSGAPVGETDDMVLVGILSTQLVHRQFVKDFRQCAPLSASDRVKICNLN